MSGGDGTRPSGRRTAVEYVHEELRYRILTGELKGGTHLTQADVAHEMDVSTTPVREAFRQLATEGLVALDTHRGVVVHKPDLEDAEELFALRRLLEPYAAQLAVQRITDEEVAAIKEFHEEMLAARSVSDWFSLNRNFHRTLISASRSSRLVSTLHSLIDATAIYLALSLRTVSQPFHIGNKDHTSILQALETRDADALSEAVLLHLEHSRTLVQDALKGSSVADLGQDPATSSSH
ncbi:MAG: GntR family transcriptional regulator [Actinomycetota bacterium]